MLKELYLHEVHISIGTCNKRATYTKEVVNVVAQNDRLLVIDDHKFTRINVYKNSHYEARTVDEVGIIRNDAPDYNYIVIELYSSRDDKFRFIQECNKILSTYPEFRNYLLNSVGEVIELMPC